MNLTLENVVKQVGTETHLYSMSLTLQPGLNVLLGPTLAGKTSLMRLMAGLDKPTKGRILVDGKDVTQVSVQKRSVAFVYQQFVNYPSFNVFENIASPLRLAGLSHQVIREKVMSVATLMHLEPMLKRLPNELSGGQQQRVAIARALVKEAGLLLFDEPLVNLDYKLREELRAEMREIFARRDAVVVYSTTEPFEALTLGGQVAVLSEGRLLQTGSALEVYHYPNSVRVGQVFSDPPINLLEGHLSAGRGHLLSGVEFVLPPHMAGLNGTYRLGIRANHVGVKRTHPEDLQLEMTLNLAELSGSETYLHSSMNTAGMPIHLVAQLPGIHTIELGRQISLFIDPQRLFAFDSSGSLVAAPQQNGTYLNTQGNPNGNTNGSSNQMGRSA